MVQPDFNNSSMNDSSVEERLHRLDQILEGRDYESSQADLATLSQDGHGAVRERALDVFWKLTDPEFIDLSPELIQLDPDFIDSLIELARHDAHLPVRIEAVKALGRYIYEGFRRETLAEEDYQKVKEFLWNRYHLMDESLDIRRTCLEALGYITDEETEQLIREAHRSPELQMRISALFAMGRSGMDMIWDSILLQELRNPDPQVRFEAVRAAGETYMACGAELLERLTQDPERRLRLEAIKALGNAGRPRSRELLRTLLQSPDEDIRDAASGALSELDYFQEDSDAEVGNVNGF